MQGPLTLCGKQGCSEELQGVGWSDLMEATGKTLPHTTNNIKANFST